MECRQFLERYSDYDDSLLTARELSEFRAHLSACASCARYDRVLRKGRMLARQLPSPEPDPTLALRLHQRLAESRSRRSRTGAALPPLATAALAAVTILLVATSALALLERTEDPAPRTPMAAAPSSAPAAPPSPAVLLAMAGRSTALPAVPGRTPRAWVTERVDHRLPSSYSPLVTGPPAYRATRAYPPGPGSSNRRTLD